MKHFSETVKLRLLYTLAVNQQPLILQMFPGTEGWPFHRHQGSCGRLMVWASSRPLWGPAPQQPGLPALLYPARGGHVHIGVIDLEQGEWNEWLPALTLQRMGRPMMMIRGCTFPKYSKLLKIVCTQMQHLLASSKLPLEASKQNNC
uniref:Uncharacterized protein n=1 Tax=Oncorhynchus tshawytscha TaxID=74940 RepID=A0A8C8HWY0_ONCTS